MPRCILTLTRADFWALAGIYAVDKAIELANAACDDDNCLVPDSGLVFQWGRQVNHRLHVGTLLVLYRKSKYNKKIC